MPDDKTEDRAENLSIDSRRRILEGIYAKVPEGVVLVGAERAAYRSGRKHAAQEVAQNAAQEVAQNLEDLKKQIENLQATEPGGDKLAQMIERFEKTIDRTSEASSRLQAEILLPPEEEMRVRLVPSDSLDRLEEYRSDENKAYLLIGIFSGAVLGILSNWVTADDFQVTRISVTLMLLFVTLATLAYSWARQSSQRASRIRQRILYQNSAELDGQGV